MLSPLQHVQRQPVGQRVVQQRVPESTRGGVPEYAPGGSIGGRKEDGRRTGPGMALPALSVGCTRTLSVAVMKAGTRFGGPVAGVLPIERV